VGFDEGPLQRARDAVLLCQGYGLADLSFVIVETTDAVNIKLRFGPPRPDITISAQSVHHFAIHRLPHDDIPFVDLEAVIQVPDQPWPDRVPHAIAATPSFPPLLWIHADGPATVDLVAEIVTVLSEAAHPER
jgi:hypothetical protein